MFTNISWIDYIIAVIMVLTIYYLFIGLRYCSGEFKELLSGKRKLNSKPTMPNNSNGEDFFYDDENSGQAVALFEEIKDDEFAEVEHLIERLKMVIADGSRKKMVPQEFKQYLCLVLKEYPSIRNSSLQSSINELVVSECQKYGAVTLSEDEVDLLWNDEM